MSEKPEKLVPYHIASVEEDKSKKGKKVPVSAREKHQAREAVLESAPELEGLLSASFKEKMGAEPPPGLNLSLLVIEEFEGHLGEAEDLRQVVRTAKDPKEKRIALELYSATKKNIDEYLAYGASFEKAFREYIKSKNRYVEFASTLKDITKLNGALQSPSFVSLPETVKFDEKSYGRLERIMEEATMPEYAEIKDEVSEALKTIYGENSAEYKEEMQNVITLKGEKLPRTKKEMLADLEKSRLHMQELWEDPMVRYFAGRHELRDLLTSFAKGDDVIETQSVIKNLNELYDWEVSHPRTTIGGILVGDPGVGKTTLVKHYLSERGRNFKYLDLSEDVTRYMLYGSKSTEFKRPADYYEQLVMDLDKMEPEDFQSFIKEHSAVVKSTFGVKDDEAAVTLIAQIEEALEQGGEVIQGAKDNAKLAERLAAAKAKMTTLANQSFRKELANEFSHIVKRNGWRDGVIISSLRAGHSLILDEFNKNKNWSLIYGLMTAKPGEKWYFADNDEYITIPDDWRMYFTANIGRKHGGFVVAEALASRAEGKVMEINYPESREEMQVALAALSNPEGKFLRPKEDLAKLYFLINEFFVKARNEIKDKNQTLPISFRTIRDIAEKLIMYKDKKTGTPVYRATNKSFDEAAFSVLIESYAMYEDKKLPTELVKLGTSVGLFLNDSIKDKVTQYITKEEYEEKKKTFEAHSEDFNAVVAKIRGLSRSGMNASVPPVSRQF